MTNYHQNKDQPKYDAEHWSTALTNDLFPWQLPIAIIAAARGINGLQRINGLQLVSEIEHREEQRRAGYAHQISLPSPPQGVLGAADMELEPNGFEDMLENGDFDTYRAAREKLLADRAETDRKRQELMQPEVERRREEHKKLLEDILEGRIPAGGY